MDHIIVGGFHPDNVIARSNVLFIASFDDNDSILSQMQVLTMLCESFIKSLTIVLPYFPVATMERILFEGEVATANTVAVHLHSYHNSIEHAKIHLTDVISS